MSVRNDLQFAYEGHVCHNGEQGSNHRSIVVLTLSRFMGIKLPGGMYAFLRSITVLKVVQGIHFSDLEMWVPSDVAECFCD